MKKLVIFTLAMVLVSSMAFAFVDENAVAVDDAQAASTGGTNVAVDAQGNPIANKGSQAATNGGTNVAVEDTLNNLRYQSPNYEITDVLNNLRYQSPDYYIVDNAILANVNVKDDSFFGAQTGSIRFFKSQHAEISGSFNFADGVSNTNSAAGNLNTQAASTTIAIGSIGSSGGRH